MQDGSRCSELGESGSAVLYKKQEISIGFSYNFSMCAEAFSQIECNSKSLFQQPWFHVFSPSFIVIYNQNSLCYQTI